MSAIQSVHDLFRGAAELSKRVRSASLVFEAGAALFVVEGILPKSGGIPVWRPPLVLGLIIIGMILRLYGEHVSRFAESCRSGSAKAFALDLDISAARASELRSGAPSLAQRLASKLPAGSLQEYYSPSNPPGDDRLREMYAHNAFYTWRLLRGAAWWYGVIGVVILSSVALVMYWLAASPGVEVPRTRVLNALLTVFLAVLGLRALSLAVTTALGGMSTRRLSDALIADPLPEGERLRDLTAEYDFQRAGAPGPPTMLYRVLRRRLGEEWGERKIALVSPPGDKM